MNSILSLRSAILPPRISEYSPPSLFKTKFSPVLFGDGFVQTPPPELKPVPGYGEVSPEILSALGNIETEGVKLGEGVFGRVYRITVQEGKTSKNYVVKVPHPKDMNEGGIIRKAGVDFTPEADIVAAIPENLNSAMKLVGLVESPIGRMMVLSYVEGNKLHPDTNPLTVKQLDSLIGFYYGLDLAGINQNDTYYENVLTYGNQAHVLDYGLAFRCSPIESDEDFAKNLVFGYRDIPLGDARRFIPERNLYCPRFRLLQNVTNFASHGLQTYFDLMLHSPNYTASDVRSLFREFLVLQGKHLETYTDKLAQNVSDQDMTLTKDQSEALAYEKLRARVLQQYPNEVLDIEAYKLQSMYYAFRSWYVTARDKSDVGNYQTAVLRKAAYRSARLAEVRTNDKIRRLQIQSKYFSKNNVELLKYLRYERAFAQFMMGSLDNLYQAKALPIRRPKGTPEYRLPAIAQKIEEAGPKVRLKKKVSLKSHRLKRH